MVTDKIKELQQYRGKVAELEKAIERDRRKELATLHAKMGYASTEELIAALRGSTRGGAPRRARGKRARITPEMKQQIKAAVQSGKTGAEIAREFGISLPSVQNVKKEFGLVRKSKK